MKLLWIAGGWYASRRRPRVLPEHVERLTYREQTRGLGLRLTERLRDRLRPAWLRLHRAPPGQGADGGAHQRGGPPAGRRTDE